MNTHYAELVPILAHAARPRAYTGGHPFAYLRLQVTLLGSFSLSTSRRR